MNIAIIFILLVVTLLTVIYKFVKDNRSIILVDYATLFDIDTMLKRGKIYVANNPDVNINDYFRAHIKEQDSLPSGIFKVLSLQERFPKRKIIFFTNMDETVRMYMADKLNAWGLRGELVTCVHPQDVALLITMLERKGFWVTDALCANEYAQMIENISDANIL